MHKVVLIRPKNIYCYNNYPALGLISIATVLKKAGFEVKIINSALEPDVFQRLKQEIPDALLVGISILTAEIPDAYQLINFIAENFQVPLAVGGMHVTLFPDQMARLPHVAYVVAGEGEEYFLNIAESLRDGRALGHKVFPKKFIDLETLPCPDYSLEPAIEKFIISPLTDKLMEIIVKPLRWLPYESSRGCPSRCSFCINVVTNNNRYRKKSAAKVIEEIAGIVSTYHINHLKIIDDNFFVDIKRVMEIFRGLQKKSLSITWDAECRCDYFNETMLNKENLAFLKEAGLVQLTLGVESGAMHTLKIMKKDIIPQQAEYAVRQCNEFGIIARSSFIIETPGETMEDIRETIRFVNRLRKYPFFTCGVGTFRPYPKCELTAKLQQEGYFLEPAEFTDWTQKEVIDLYTSTEQVRPWQVNARFSERASYYLNMESAVRLGNYQIVDSWDRLKNTFFMKTAKVRNRYLFYSCPIDMYLYKKFLVNFYRCKQAVEAR